MEPISRAPDEELLNDGMALRHHLASCFRALRKRAAQRAETTVNLHAATSTMEDAMLRHYFSKWLILQYQRHLHQSADLSTQCVVARAQCSVHSQ